MWPITSATARSISPGASNATSACRRVGSSPGTVSSWRNGCSSTATTACSTCAMPQASRGPGPSRPRFTAMVGSSPTDFRRLPDLLASAPPRPVAVPGRARGGSVVTGRVTLTSSAAATVGPVPFVYVGLFTKHAARGLPVSGAMLAGPGEFLLEDVPAGTFWVLASALPASADFDAQLVPDRTVAGAAVEAVYVPAPAAGGLPPRAAPARHHRDLVLDVLPAWSSPVLVALPRLASPAAQDWQDRR